MQDTKNLKRKLKEYQGMLSNPTAQGRGAMKFLPDVKWLLGEIDYINKRLESRKKNKLKNEKQFKKAN